MKSLNMYIIKKGDIFDEIFALFHSPDHLGKFTNNSNSKHKNIKFSYKDILISRSKNGFKTCAYHNPSFTEMCSNFNNLISDLYKIDLVFNLLF